MHTVTEVKDPRDWETNDAMAPKTASKLSNPTSVIDENTQSPEPLQQQSQSESEPIRMVEKPCSSNFEIRTATATVHDTATGPSPIVNEFSETDDRSKSKATETRSSSSLLMENQEIVTRRRLSKTHCRSEYDDSGGCAASMTPLLSKNESNFILDHGAAAATSAAAFALRQSNNATAAVNQTHVANLTLKTHVNRLICDNEQLNSRVSRVCHKNQSLALERERLLTTIQNTAAILKSTVDALGIENETPLRRLEEAKKKKDEESADSDVLERSTKCTIKEFDNLLNALQDEETAEGGDSEKKSISQYDIIVKWLNNETGGGQCSTPDDEEEENNNNEEEEVVVGVPSSAGEMIREEEINRIFSSASVKTTDKNKLDGEEAKEDDSDKTIGDDKPGSVIADDEKGDDSEFDPSKTLTESAKCVRQYEAANRSPDETTRNEHEEFINLCNTMLQRMDSMISKTSPQAGRNLAANQTAATAPADATNLSGKASRKTPSSKMPKKRRKRGRRRTQQHRRFGKDENDDIVSLSDDDSSAINSWSDSGAGDDDGNDGDNLKTFQRCLAQLEQMNVRRTNKALTQTLIIKTLRKLLARRCCHTAKRTNKNCDLSSSSLSSVSLTTSTLSPASPAAKSTRMFETSTGGLAIATQTADTADDSPVAKNLSLREEGTPKMGAGEIYQIITNVSKSIIYRGDTIGEELFRWEGDRHRLATGDAKRVEDRTDGRLMPATGTVVGTRCRKRRIATELKRLREENELKPMSSAWIYIGVLLILSQLPIVRWCKYVLRIF